MEFVRREAPYLAPAASVSTMMLHVLVALVPAAFAHVWYFGPGFIFNLIIASIFCVGGEALMMQARGRKPEIALTDFSVLVTAALLAFALPSLTPWWVTATGSIFAVVVAKHLYGGLGNNLFNPAMVGYVVVLISFPQHLTAWPAPAELAALGFGPLETLQTIFSGEPPGAATWDAITAATALDAVRNGTTAGQPIAAIEQAPAFGILAGHGWEWVALWYAIGGGWLLARRIISWHVPVAVAGSVLLFSTAGWLLDPHSHPTPLFDLFSGAVLLGAFFIATDPVSGCASPRGRLIFGAGVGILTLVIRRWGGYPDGIAFAVLLMNLAAPLIDRFTRPRIFGHD